MAGGLELLALDSVARAGAPELVAYHLLGPSVGVADQGEIGFGLDHKVLGSEACHGDPLHSIGKHVREAQVIVIGRHLATLAVGEQQRGDRHDPCDITVPPRKNLANQSHQS